MSVQGKHVIYSNAVISDEDERPLGTFKFDHVGDELPAQTTGDHLIMYLMGVKGSKKVSTLTQLVRHGAPLKVISRLEQIYRTSQREISSYLSIPPSTINRRKQRGEHLSSQETDRAVRYARLYKSAQDMMQGDNEATLRWLKSPRKILSGETPMERATTEAGAAEVEQLIGRIRHGVFS